MVWAEFDTVFGGAPRAIDWPAAGFDASLPLLDVGSGTGLGVVQLAEAHPGAQVHAVEPDGTMRTLLMHRVVTTPGLAARVTVWPCPLDAVDLPGPWGGVVATGLLYFLSPDERRAAWKVFAEHLVPGASVVLEQGSSPNPAEEEPERLLGTRQVGRLRYERWFGQGPQRDGSVRFTNTVRVWDQEHLVSEDASTWRCWPLTTATTIQECTATGAFDVEPLGTGYLAARRRTHRKPPVG